MIEDFIAKFDALPGGYFEGLYVGRKYGVTKTVTANRKRGNLVAEELGGTDFISFNLYRPDSGAQLKPCEMPAAKVVDFVMGVTIL